MPNKRIATTVTLAFGLLAVVAVAADVPSRDVVDTRTSFRLVFDGDDGQTLDSFVPERTARLLTGRNDAVQSASLALAATTDARATEVVATTFRFDPDPLMRLGGQAQTTIATSAPTQEKVPFDPSPPLFEWPTRAPGRTLFPNYVSTRRPASWVSLIAEDLIVESIIDGLDVYLDRETVVNLQSLTVLVPALGVALTMRHTDLDNRLADHFEDNGSLFGTGVNDFLDDQGPWIPVGVTAAILLANKFGNTSDESYQRSVTLARAMLVNFASTQLLKAAISDVRPLAEGRDGFPSGHASTTMAFAAAVDELYGWEYGILPYGFSLMVGLERMDDGNHFLSQVIFGWALGYVNGKSVAASGNRRLVAGFEVRSYVDVERNAIGITFSREF